MDKIIPLIPKDTTIGLRKRKVLQRKMIVMTKVGGQHFVSYLVVVVVLKKTTIITTTAVKQ